MFSSRFGGRFGIFWMIDDSVAVSVFSGRFGGRFGILTHRYGTSASGNRYTGNL